LFTSALVYFKMPPSTNQPSAGQHAESFASSDRRQTVQRLAEQLRQMESANKPQKESLSTGIGALDRLLPTGGFQPGALVEWLNRRPGGGGVSLAVTVAAAMMQSQGTAVMIDPQRSFYPLAAPALTRKFERLMVVHPATQRDALWALEQSLRCGGVSVAVAWLSELQDRAYRRMQLAAEVGGGIGLLIRSSKHRAQPSWADVRLLVESLPAVSGVAFPSGRLVRIELIHCRGRASGGAVELEIDDETGDVRLASRVVATKNSLSAATA